MALTIRSDQFRRVAIKKDRKIPYIVNLGCGTKCEPDAVGIDVIDWGQEILWDVMEGIPLPNSSVKGIRMFHFMEHISYEKLDEVFREIYRICIDGAKLDLRHPHSSHKDAYAAPHVSFWNETSTEGFFEGFVNPKQERLPLFRIERMETRGRNLFVIVKVLKGKRKEVK